MEDKYYNIKDAAEILGVHPRTLSKLCKAGKIKGAHQVGGFKSKWTINIREFRGESEK